MQKIAAKNSMADVAAAQIRQEIVTGRFVPGQRLRETLMAQALGVSRGPVREALKLLKAEGLVHEEPNKGTFVSILSPADVGEIFEVRLAVETRAVKLISRAHRVRDLTSLQESAQRIGKAAIANDDRLVAQADLDFHEAICRLSRIARLHDIFLMNVQLWWTLLLVHEELHTLVADTSDEHWEIVRAIKSRDEVAATSTLESHLEDSKRRLVSCLKSQPPSLADLRSDAG